MFPYLSKIFFLFLFIYISYSQDCNKINCVLPNCFCASKNIPGGLKLSDTPQFIFFTLDDSIKKSQFQSLNELDFILRKIQFRDALGCNPKLSFYVRQLETDFDVLNLLQKKGSINLHTYSHTTNDQTSYPNWTAELTTVKKNIIALGKLKADEVIGSRAPYLKTNDAYFQTLVDMKMTFDSSLTYSNKTTKQSFWPFTLDYSIPEPTNFCVFGSCPTWKYKGLWEIPMINFDYDVIGNIMDPDFTKTPYYELMTKFQNNFKDGYNFNKVPRGIYWHWRYMSANGDFDKIDDEKIRFLTEFITWILNNYKDVVFVTETELIQWIRNPKTLTQLKANNPFKWKCPNIVSYPDEICSKKTCIYSQQSFDICGSVCPDVYPGINVNWVFPSKNSIPSNAYFDHWPGILEIYPYTEGKLICADSLTVSHSNSVSARSFIVSIHFCRSVVSKINKIWTPYTSGQVSTNNKVSIKFLVNLDENTKLSPYLPFYIGGFCINPKWGTYFDEYSHMSWAIDFFSQNINCELNQCKSFCGDGVCSYEENLYPSTCPFDCGNYSCKNGRRLFLDKIFNKEV